MVASTLESTTLLRDQLKLLDFLFISLCLHNLYSFLFGIFKTVEILSTKTESELFFLKKKKISSNIVIVWGFLIILRKADVLQCFLSDF